MVQLNQLQLETSPDIFWEFPVRTRLSKGRIDSSSLLQNNRKLLMSCRINKVVYIVKCNIQIHKDVLRGVKKPTSTSLPRIQS